MNYRACLYSSNPVQGGYWTTLATGHNRQACLNKLAIFLARQPLHHWGIRKDSLIKLYSQDKAAFVETLSIQ